MSVIDISSERERRESEAWDRYVKASTKFKQTLAVEDGRMRSREWIAFVEVIRTGKIARRA